MAIPTCTLGWSSSAYACSHTSHKHTLNHTHAHTTYPISSIIGSPNHTNVSLFHPFQVRSRISRWVVPYRYVKMYSCSSSNRKSRAIIDHVDIHVIFQNYFRFKNLRSKIVHRPVLEIRIFAHKKNV